MTRSSTSVIGYLADCPVNRGVPLAESAWASREAARSHAGWRPRPPVTETSCSGRAPRSPRSGRACPSTRSAASSAARSTRPRCAWSPTSARWPRRRSSSRPSSRTTTRRPRCSASWPAVADPGAVLATTTSSLSVDALAEATGAADRFVGLHVFNPVPKMKLVELAFPAAASEETRRRSHAAVRGAGQDRRSRSPTAPGFVVNRLLFPYLFSAVEFLEESGMEPEDVDACMTLGAGHPMGPLALLDFVGPRRRGRDRRGDRRAPCPSGCARWSPRARWAGRPAAACTTTPDERPARPPHPLLDQRRARRLAAGLKGADDRVGRRTTPRTAARSSRSAARSSCR